MACLQPASESPRGGTINSHRIDPVPPATEELAVSGSGVDTVDPRAQCSASLPNSFLLNFCNIRGLYSNFHSVEHHLLFTKPHIFFLTETQVGETTDSKPFSVPSYCLYSNFKAKAGCCAYFVQTFLALVLPTLNLLTSLLYGFG